jgi:hypothetical protein
LARSSVRSGTAGIASAIDTTRLATNTKGTYNMLVYTAVEWKCSSRERTEARGDESDRHEVDVYSSIRIEVNTSSTGEGVTGRGGATNLE